MGLVKLTTFTKQGIVSHINVSCSTAQGHNAAPPVRLEPANPSIWSQALPDLVVYSSGTVFIFFLTRNGTKFLNILSPFLIASHLAVQTESGVLYLNNRDVLDLSVSLYLEY